MRGKNSQISTGQHFVNRGTRQRDITASNVDCEKVEPSEHRIDIADESSDLLGYDIFSGKLALVKQKQIDGIKFNESDSTNNNVEGPTDAKLSSKALVWGAQMLSLEDVISVSYSAGLRHFTVHSYIRKGSRFTCIFKPKRSQKDFCFLATSAEEAIQWINGFTEQQCFVKCLPHPFAASNKHSSELLVNVPQFDQIPIKCKSSPRVLVILNPRSGHGRSSKVFYEKAAPIFELAGFKMEVVKTTAAGHAKKLASTVDFSTCPNGIICVGGDGIVNEVLNGLLSRDNQKEAISIPIGIIPAGSDNSLVWTILGVRDPISAAITIVKGGLTATDVFAVEWIQTGIIHYGTTVSYFGFLSDVLELSEKYQRRFGPLRYFVAGFLKFLCIPKYDFEIEYLPLSESDNRQLLENTDKIEVSDLYTDIMGRSTSMPRASSLSIIESVGVPTKAQEELYTVSSEPYDPKSKRLSKGKRNRVEEPEEVIHPQLPISTTPNRARTRALKSRANDQRSSWTPAMDNKEDNCSTTPDHSPIWDAEPKCEDSQETEVHIELPCKQEEVEEGIAQEFAPNLDQKWIVKKGTFIGVLACNHSCKTVQSLSSQVVAPHAVHDDNVLDLLMVQGSGRLRLLRFLMLLQFGRHLSLPYVEYVKVKSVKLRAVRSSQNGCGIDGELLKHNGQIMCSMLPDQCRLLGRPARDSV